MPQDLHVAHTATGATLYAIIRDSLGDVWDTTTTTFVTYTTADLANYAILLAEQGTASRYYRCDIPGTNPGYLHATIYEMAGGTPAEGDLLVDNQVVEWNTSYRLTLRTLQNLLPASLVAGKMDSSVSYIDSGVISFTAIANDALRDVHFASNAIAALQNGVATAASITALADLVTDVLARLPANLVDGRIDAHAGTASGSIHNDAADALLDRSDGVETSITLRHALRAILSALVGRLAGAATSNITIRDAGNTKNRISAEVDGLGNRISLSLDLT